jgi:hypothetical protein
LARRKKSAFLPPKAKDIMTQTTETNETEAKAKAGAVIVPVTPFEQNCTLIWCEATKKAVVVDPGGDVPKILAAIKQTGVTVEKIWLTHGHIDHVGGAAELRDTLKAPIEGPHASDKFLLDNVVLSGTQFGMTGVRNFVPDRWLNEGDRVEIGELSFDILHCPGHSPGSVVFFSSRRCVVQRLGRTHRPARRQPRHPDQLDHRKAVTARRRRRLHLRPWRGLQHRPGEIDQPVPDRRDVALISASPPR